MAAADWMDPEAHGSHYMRVLGRATGISMEAATADLKRAALTVYESRVGDKPDKAHTVTTAL